MENETLVGPWLWGEQIFVSHRLRLHVARTSTTEKGVE